MKINQLLENFPDFSKVYQLAQEGHKNQTRNDKKTPYMVHIDAVILGVWDLATQKSQIVTDNHWWAEQYLIVAAAHDLLEDTQVTPDQIQKLISNPRFNSEWILNAIIAITKKPKGEEEYINYLQRVAEHPLSRYVKRADLAHNISDLKPGNMRDKYSVSLWFLENFV